MRVQNRLVFSPVAALLALFLATTFLAATPVATAASTPTPQKITGIVQTVILEHPHEHPTVIDTPASTTVSNVSNDTIRILRTGSTVVRLAEGSLPATKDGATVSVTVVPVAGGEKRVLSATTITAPVAEAISSTHHVYVALVLPRGLAADASITDASTRAMVQRVSQFWSDQTQGKVSFDTPQVLSYGSAYSCSDANATYNMWTEAQAKMPSATGPGKHLVLVAPGGAEELGCDYGLGTVRAVEADGNLVFVSGLNQSLLAHELGHNLGLYHSNSLRCSGAQDMPKVSLDFPGCQATAYDDLLDVMGYSGSGYGEGNLNAVHLDGMRLLPNAVRRIPANSGVTTARITPLSTTTINRTLKVTDPNGANYFVEYRTNSGRDAVAGRNPWQPAWGVRVLRDDPRVPASGGSYELDATPTSLSSYDYNRSIPVGHTFVAASHKVTIKVSSQDPTGATLTITNSAAPLPPLKVTQSAPTRALVGAAISTATRVSDLRGLPVANWPVTVQKRLVGTTTWRSLRTLTTTSAGTASYRFTNGLSSYYRWVTAPVSGTPSYFSPPVATTSTARVVQSRPSRSMTHGHYLSVSGLVSSVPSPVVYIQYHYRGGIWRTGPRATVKGTVVSGRILMNARGTAYTRLYVRARASYVGSTSSYYATALR